MPAFSARFLTAEAIYQRQSWRTGPRWQTQIGGRKTTRVDLVAIGLGQIGEFSFVLATIGLARNVIPGELYAAILAAVVVTIASLDPAGAARLSQADRHPVTRESCL